MVICIDYLDSIRRNGQEAKIRSYKEIINLTMFILSTFFFLFLYTFLDLNVFALDFRIQHICLLLFSLLCARSLQSPLSAFPLLSTMTKSCASLALLQIISLSIAVFLCSHYHHPPGTAVRESTSTGFHVRESLIPTWMCQYDMFKETEV